MESNPEYLELLQQQAAQRRQEDYLNTNILQSKDPTLMIAQDVVVGFALSYAVESVTIDVLKDSLQNAISRNVAISVPVEGGGRRLLLGKKAIAKAISAAEKKSVTIAQNGAKFINQTIDVLSS